MKTKFLLALTIGLFVSTNLFADSPLTSTSFCQAYKDSAIVKKASEASGKLTPELMDYLIDKNNPIDLKMAVINTLSWDVNGKDNSTTFKSYLTEKNISLNPRQASAENLICYAYLKALDDYSNVEDALRYAKFAKARKTNSFTIYIISAIIEAQAIMETSSCDIYNLANDVRNNEELVKDMNENAVAIIFDYIDMYKC